MSITFIYNSSTINLFTTEDLGSITATPTSEDYGSITAAHTQAETYSEVQYTADAYPFGTATIGGSADTIQQRVYIYGVTGGFQVTAQTQILLIHAWAGSGSLFEIGGGLERIVAPYLGADPETTTLFTVSGTVGEAFATLYNIEDTTTLSTEDFGSVAVGGSFVDYGQISVTATEIEVYGTVSDVFAVPYEGTISVTGSAAESFTESGYVGSGSYGGFSGSGHVRIPVRYEGSGSLFSISGGIEQKTWIYPNSHYLVEYTPSDIDNNPNTSYFNGASYQTGGTGIGSVGGFNIGEHILLRGDTLPGAAFVNFPTEFFRIPEITFYVIRGNNSNGGRTPTGDLGVHVGLGAATTLVTVGDTAFDNVKKVTITGNAQVGTYINLIIYNTGDGDYAIQKVEHWEQGPEFPAGIGFPASQIPAGGFTLSGAQSAGTRTFLEAGPVRISNFDNPTTVRLGFGNESTASLSLTGDGTDSLTKDYDEDNILVYGTEDYGNITAAATTTEDNSLVTELNVVVEDYASINNSATVTPVSGGLNVSGSAGAIFLLQVFETGGGSITLSGAGSTPFIPNFISTGLFGFTGTVDVYLVREFAGSGNIARFSGGEDNRNTRNYDETAVVTFSTTDNGLVSAVATSTEDNGLISLDSASIDNGQIFFEPTPFGGMTITGGASNARPLRTFLYTGATAQIQLSGVSVNRFDPGPWIATGLFGITGTANVAIPYAYTASGTFDLFTFDLSFLGHGPTPTESKTDNYNLSSVDVFSSEDYGLVTANATSTEDYGFVSAPALEESENFGTIAFGNTTNNPFGTINTSGAAVTANPRIFSYNKIGGGLLFNIVGGEGAFVPGYQGSGTITLSSTTVYNFIIDHIGNYEFTVSGGISSETKTSDYSNDNQTWDLYHESEFGTITTNPQPPRDELYPVGEPSVSLQNSTQNFGSVTNSNLERYYDFGQLSTTADVKSASGSLFAITGTITEFVPELAHTGSGTIRLTGTAPSSFFPTWNGSGTITTSGGDGYAMSPHIIGNYTIFPTGIGGEAKTQHYNLSSRDVYSTEDYGFIAATPGTTEDHGLLGGLNPENDDWGSIFTRGQTNEPFGLFKISGAADVQGLRKPSWTGNGYLFALGGSASVNTRTTDNTILFQISGAADTPFSFRHISTGVLFSNGFSGEAVAKSYNQSSVATFSSVDYGQVSTLFTGTLIDNGGITLPTTGGEVDYGSVVFDATTGSPFGLFRITGSTNYVYKPEFAQTTTGSLFFGGASINSFLPNWVGSGSIDLSGGDGYNLSPLIISSGGLFTIGGAAEKVTFDYNLSSTDVFGTEDWGLLSQVPTATEDFASILDGNTEAYNYGTIFHGNQTNTAFGSAFLSGAAVTAGLRKPSYNATGSLFGFNGAAVAVAQTDDTTGLFRITGAADTPFAFRYISTGVLFSNGFGGEAVTKSYNLSSALTFTSEDYGLVTANATSTEDYGSLTAPLTGGEVDYGSIIFTSSTGSPFGLFRIIGSTVYSYKPEFAQIGTGGITLSGNSINSFLPNWNGSGGATFSGGDGYAMSPHIIVTGGLFTIGGAAEKVTFDYNLSSTDVFSTQDFGLLSQSPTATENFGSVLDGNTQAYNYGNIFHGNQTNFAFGSAFLSGAAVTAGLRKPSYNATGSLFALGGASESKATNKPESTVLFSVSGSPIYNLSLRHISTGSLFGVGGAAERVTVSYNQSSVVPFSTEDLGLVSTAATTTEDYGQLPNVVTDYDRRGTIILDQTTGVPFGSITISATTEYVYKPNFLQIGSGSINLTGNSTNSFLPNWNGSGSISLSGGDGYAMSPHIIVTGGLFSNGIVGEAVTKHYNISSVDVYSVVDYGSVPATAGSTDDYGLITDDSTRPLNFGSISTRGQNNEPFGLFQISGAAVTAGLRKPSYNATGTITFSGTSPDSFIPNYESTGLFRIAGSAVPNFAFVNPAEALLTVDIQSDERRTYHYNDGTVTVFSTEDLGLISNNATTLEDNGSITGHITEYDNRGFIRDTSTVRAASGTITISGSVDDDFIAENAHTGSGTITITSTTTTAFIPNWVGTGLFDFSGGDAYAFSLLQIVTGGLFTNGIVGEAVTKHYNISSVETFTTEDYGSITSSATTTEDYGLVTEQDGESVDLGSIGITQTTEPFGLFRISGAADIFFQPERGSDSTVLFTLSGAGQEQFIPNWNSSGGITISGAAGLAAYRNFPYVASGALFTNGINGEAVTKAYNQSSVLPFNTEDYGSVSGSGSTEDYGSITDSATNELDYGHIWEYPGFGQPFGGITISGAVNNTGRAIFIRAPYAAFGTFTVLSNNLVPMEESFSRGYAGLGLLQMQIASANTNRSRDYVGSGSLFAVGGAAESKTTNKPESTVLFTIGGSGDPPIITLKYFGGGTITISGTAGEAYVRRGYEGSGSLFALSGVAEAFGADPPENAILHTISGTAEPIIITRAFQGSGTINVSGSAGERQLDHYHGSGVFQVTGIASAEESYAPAAEIGSGSLFTVIGAAESFTANPDENTVLYDITGTAEPIIRTQAFQGSGTITVSGQLGLKVVLHFYGSGGITLSGTVGESFTPATEIGSGSITLSGTKVESFTKGNYTGSGSITLSGAAVETKLDHYTGSGTATLSGAAALKIVIIITGSGSLFAVGGAAESKTTNKPESTILFAVSGAATESFGKGNYDGSGTKTFFGAGIEKQTDDYVGSGTATLSGAADTDRTRSFVGSGSLFAIGGAAEAVAVVEPGIGLFTFSGTAAESTTKGNYDGSGTITLSGAATESFIKAPYVGSGTITISGQFSDIKLTYGHQGFASITISGSAERSRTRDFVGSGSLFAIGGAAESTTKDLPEFTGLFSFSGTRESEKTTVREISGGGVITITGQATNVRFNRGWTGSGLITLTGNTIEKATTDYVGSGSLFAIGGGAESKTTNPPEDIVLYRFTGTAGDQKLTFREVFSGTITLSGSAGSRLVINNIGSGTTTLSGIGAESKGTDLIGVSSPGYIFFSAFGGTKYARTFPGQTEGGTITLSGRADTPRTQKYFGAGSLFAIGGAVESKSTNIPENTVLFVATGAAATPRTRDFVGSGSINLSGDASITRTFGYAGSGTITLSGTADTDRTRAFSGTGSLFAVGGAAEAKTSNKPESTVLFVFTGDTKTPRARAYVGSGSLFAIGGAAEAVAVAPETTGLFRISGDAGLKFIVHYNASGQITISGNGAEAFVRPNYDGSGSFGGFSGSAEESASVAEEFSGTQTISGTAEPIIVSRAYRGTGSLFAVGGAAESKTTNKPESTVLYNFVGEANVNFIEGGYQASGTITTSGDAVTELRIFQPEFTFVTII